MPRVSVNTPSSSSPSMDGCVASRTSTTISNASALQVLLLASELFFSTIFSLTRRRRGGNTCNSLTRPHSSTWAAWMPATRQNMCNDNAQHSSSSQECGVLQIPCHADLPVDNGGPAILATLNLRRILAVMLAPPSPQPGYLGPGRRLPRCYPFGSMETALSYKTQLVKKEFCIVFLDLHGVTDNPNDLVKMPRSLLI